MASTLVPSTTERSIHHAAATQNGHEHHPHQSLYEPRWDAPDHGRYVSQAEYWAQWYEAESSYEWNNGYLEAKPMPNLVQLRLFQWFLDILRQYINTYHNADLMFHEIGFSMSVPDPDQPGMLKEVVRKPDVAALRHDNPVAWQEHERSYHGICDLCVESLSDSTVGEVTRDTEIKKSEYEFAGVQEYYILDPSHQHMHFYQRTPTGVYREIQPDAQGVIRSQVLPGFQFRFSDLRRQPTLEEMALDEVYQGYVLLRYQAAAARAERERERAERYAAMLRELGVDVDVDS